MQFLHGVDIGDGIRRSQNEWIGDKALFVPFDAPYFADLVVNGTVVMNNTDASVQCHRNCKGNARRPVHCLAVNASLLARLDSVTVSIGLEMNGVLRVSDFVSLDCRDTLSDAKSM